LTTLPGPALFPYPPRVDRRFVGLGVGIALLLVADTAAVIGHSEPSVRTVSRAEVTTTLPTATTTSTVPPTTIPPPPPPPRQIVFSRRAPGATAVHVQSVSPTGASITPPPGTPDVPFAQVSPALGKVVYEKMLSGSSHEYSGCGVAGCSQGIVGTVETGIAEANLDHSGEVLLTHGGYDTHPSFSPDGMHIAFLSHRQRPNSSEYDAAAMMDADGSNARPIAPTTNGTDTDPAWSPDGRSVVVLRHLLGESTGAVMLLPLDGSAPRRLATGEFRQLSWAHDGSALVGVQEYSVPVGSQHQPVVTGSEVWLIPIDGRRPRQLTHLSPSQPTYADFCQLSGVEIVDVRHPLFSPDDSEIAFLSSARHGAEFAHVFDVAVVSTSGSGFSVVHTSPRAPCPVPPASQPGSGDDVDVLGWLG